MIANRVPDELQAASDIQQEIEDYYARARYQYLTGVSSSATDLFKQTLTINAISQAMHGFSSASGAGNVDV